MPRAAKEPTASSERCHWGYASELLASGARIRRPAAARHIAAPYTCSGRC
ncbi:hypothetical protein H7U16_25965 [Klebsiella pneumoniae]|uniref:Uncharacterized protein n=1 Tax=Klebsiella pneumoniae TaxID=573 RepID=A0A7X1LMZ0_KLEPN|nr:hypothetical protein [Klebsiella pneumoniae]